MTESGKLSFREFLLCLCIGAVLQLIPLMGADECVRAGNVAADAVSTARARRARRPAAPPRPTTLTGPAASAPRCLWVAPQELSLPPPPRALPPRRAGAAPCTRAGSA
jgi:hypothetical protein